MTADRWRGREPLLLAVAAALASASLGISAGMYRRDALALMSVAWILALAAAFAGRGAAATLPRSDQADAGPARTAQKVIAVAAVCACFWHVVIRPGLYLVPAHPVMFRVCAACATLLTASALVSAVPAFVARFRFAALAACFGVMAFGVVHASPRPLIDVWVTQQLGAGALLLGYNPYAITYPLHQGGARFISPELLEAGRIGFYAYPPVTLALGTIALLVAGDVRYASIALMLCAAWTMRRIGRGPIAEAAAVLLLFQPKSFFVIEQAWTEPMVLGLAGLCLVAAAASSEGRGSWPVGLGGGLLAASKQYSFLVAIPVAMALPRRIRWRSAAWAAAVVLATLLPFALSDPRELWHDLVAAQMLQPFRADSLSLLVPIAAALQRPLSGVVGIAIGVLVLVLALRGESSMPQALRASAAGFLSFLLWNKQAFCNYYWLAIGLLLFALVLCAREASETMPTPHPAEVASS